MNFSFQLTRLFPFLRWGRNLNRETIQIDLMAGLTGAAIVLPQGVAFAAIAGMPPEYGLYTSMVPAIIAALFGSSWHLVSGPTTAASIVMFSSLSAIALPRQFRIHFNGYHARFHGRYTTVSDGAGAAWNPGQFYFALGHSRIYRWCGLPDRS